MRKRQRENRKIDRQIQGETEFKKETKRIQTDRQSETERRLTDKQS